MSEAAESVPMLLSPAPGEIVPESDVIAPTAPVPARVPPMRSKPTVVARPGPVRNRPPPVRSTIDPSIVPLSVSVVPASTCMVDTEFSVSALFSTLSPLRLSSVPPSSVTGSVIVTPLYIDSVAPVATLVGPPRAPPYNSTNPELTASCPKFEPLFHSVELLLPVNVTVFAPEPEVVPASARYPPTFEMLTSVGMLRST